MTGVQTCALPIFTPNQSFRTLPAYEIEHIPAKIRLMLRRAQAYQFNLKEMYDGVNASDKKIVNDISFHVNDSITDIGKKVRKYLSVTVEDQKSFGNSENAFKEWRKALENLGLFVFKDAFQSEEFSGRSEERRVGKECRSRWSPDH